MNISKIIIICNNTIIKKLNKFKILEESIFFIWNSVCFNVNFNVYYYSYKFLKKFQNKFYICQKKKINC